jgi:hypothetical protein
MPDTAGSNIKKSHLPKKNKMAARTGESQAVLIKCEAACKIIGQNTGKTPVVIAGPGHYDKIAEQ